MSYVGKIIAEKVDHGLYTVYFRDNGKILGEFVQDESGFFGFYCDTKGSWSSWTLKAIADRLDEINKPWDEKINEYFKSEL